MKITLIVYCYPNEPAIQRPLEDVPNIPRIDEEVVVFGPEGIPYYGLVSKVTNWPYNKTYGTDVFVSLPSKEFADVAKNTKKWKRFDYVSRIPK
jgi:hypothetical protein